MSEYAFLPVKLSIFFKSNSVIFVICPEEIKKTLKMSILFHAKIKTVTADYCNLKGFSWPNQIKKYCLYFKQIIWEQAYLKVIKIKQIATCFNPTKSQPSWQMKLIKHWQALPPLLHYKRIRVNHLKYIWK